MEPKVLYEDNHLIAIDKPHCMPSQGDESGDLSALEWTTEYIREKYNKPGNVFCGLLHRLDRPVGGVMVFARTSKAAARMSALFRDRKIQKVYQAVVIAAPGQPYGQLEHYLGMVPGKNIARAYQKSGPERKLARLDYQLLKQSKGLALLEVIPQTGRKHQIRVQLASLGCGIVGDVKYADTDFLPDKSIALRAMGLSFQHPVRKDERVEIKAGPRNAWPWNLFPQ